MRLGLALAAIVGVAACNNGPQTPPPLRLWTNDIAYQVSTDPVPPTSRTDVVVKVVVRDKNSGKAIEGGEGRVFATSADGMNTWDGLTPGKQPGTYYAKLNFITSGNWAVGMQFRRDSTQPIERLDWRQDVFADTGGPNIK